MPRVRDKGTKDETFKKELAFAVQRERDVGSPSKEQNQRERKFGELDDLSWFF